MDFCHVLPSQQKNQLLHDTNEELQATLLNKSFQDGCQLLNVGANSSLADEFDECSKDQVGIPQTKLNVHP